MTPRVVVHHTQPIRVVMRARDHVPPHQWLGTIDHYEYSAEGAHMYTFAATVTKVRSKPLDPDDDTLPGGFVLHAKHRNRRVVSWFFAADGELCGFEHGQPPELPDLHPLEVALAMSDPGDES